MPGSDGLQEAIALSKLEDFVPADRPLCPIRSSNVMSLE